MLLKSKVFLAISTGLLVASGAIARAPAPLFIMTGIETGAPRGFVDLCRRDTASCAAPNAVGVTLTTGALAKPSARMDSAFAPTAGGEAAPSFATADDTLAFLKRVNRWVNGHVVQRTDFEIFGEGEVWQRSGVGRNAIGDCEDIALEKRFQLIRAGFPQDRLFLAVVYARPIGLHAVLIARTADGDVVLDSRTPHVSRWNEVPYSWVAIQSTNDPMVWRAPGSPDTTAEAAGSRADHG